MNKFCFIPQILYVLIISKESILSIHMYCISIYRIYKYGEKTKEDLEYKHSNI